jgi:hypothetical protein
MQYGQGDLADFACPQTVAVGGALRSVRRSR